VLGTIQANYAFDWAQAERHFRRAIELKPQLPDPHLYYAAFVLTPAGRFAEAEEHQSLAHRLDPLSAVVINATGMLRLMLRQYEASAAAFREALNVDPNYPWAHRGLGEIALLEGRYAEALQALERVEMPNLAAGLVGYARAKLGAEGEARLGIRRLEQSGHPAVAYQVAMIHMALNDVDATFHWLERARVEHSIGVVWLPVDPIWDPVRGDDRFRRLVGSMGFDPTAVQRVARVEAPHPVTTPAVPPLTNAGDSPKREPLPTLRRDG
jgi:tetratricopeptide (TPR) repeat protein